jgi:hypothetical protein
VLNSSHLSLCPSDVDTKIQLRVSIVFTRVLALVESEAIIRAFNPGSTLELGLKGFVDVVLNNCESRKGASNCYFKAIIGSRL